MLHITYGSTGTFYVTTEEKRINTSVATSKIRLLFKFTNDMSKVVKYAYGQSLDHNDNIRTYQRYTKATVSHNTTENVYTGAVNFKPFGFWKYEIYEVSWIGTVALTHETAPANENNFGSIHDLIGVVQGKVEEGKLYVTEPAGSAQIPFTQHPEPT